MDTHTHTLLNSASECTSAPLPLWQEPTDYGYSEAQKTTGQSGATENSLALRDFRLPPPTR